MPSMKDCIKSALDQGWISHDEAQQLYDRYDRLLRQVLSPTQVQAQMTKELEMEAFHRRRRTGLTEAKRIELEEILLSHNNRKGVADPGEGLQYLLEHYGQAKHQDVEHKRLAVLGQAHAEMEGLLHEFRKGAFLGDMRRRKAQVRARMDNVVKELFGESTGDPVSKTLADAWTKVTEELRQRFNAAGGAIGKLEKWGLPQVHDREALMHAGKKAWIDYIEPRLDPAKMRHPLTGQPMTRADLLDALDQAYDTIVSDGWNTREPSSRPAGSAMFARHADHRFLMFKDATNWLEYQREFGEGDPFASMMGHISTMTRDIAAMEVLGPNPTAMLNHLLAVVEKTNPTDPSLPKTKKNVGDMWAHISGTANMPIGTRLANVASGVRNLISAANLGSAQISAITDLGFQAATRRFAGLPVVSAISGMLRQFTTRGEREAVAAGLILDSSIHVMHQQARYFGSISGRTWTGYINDRVLTYSGLQAWTQAGKHAFGLAMQYELAKWVGRPLADLPEALRNTLIRHGFDELDGGYRTRWDRIGEAMSGKPLYEPRPGVRMLRPSEIVTAHSPTDRFMSQQVMQDLADRYVSMIMRETRFAVPESTVAARAGMMSQNQPGTFMGELVRSAGQFKSFGVAVAMMHGGRVAREISGGRRMSGAMYAVSLLITTTVLGAMAIELKEIAAGRDPRRIDLTKEGAKFWGAAMLQGGGLGIYGDFLFADVNRHGGTLGATIAGPMVDRVENLLKLTMGNATELAQGKKTHYGAELSKFARQNTPGSSLWFGKLAFERLLMDRLQLLIDGDAHKAFHAREQSRRKDYKQDHYWRPGQIAPARGPDFSKIWPG